MIFLYLRHNGFIIIPKKFILKYLYSSIDVYAIGGSFLTILDAEKLHEFGFNLIPEDMVVEGGKTIKILIVEKSQQDEEEL